VKPGGAVPLLPERRRVLYFSATAARDGLGQPKETTMAWTTPTLVEICIGLEINGYLPAEF
jgi:coenzyme PQQ precursor peptide PqqA